MLSRLHLRLRFGRKPDPQAMPEEAGLPEADMILGERRHGDENDDDGVDDMAVGDFSAPSSKKMAMQLLASLVHFLFFLFFLVHFWQTSWWSPLVIFND
jgi:hypothetical protein